MEDLRTKMRHFLIHVKQEWCRHVFSLAPFILVGSPYRSVIKQYERKMIGLMDEWEEEVQFHIDQLEETLRNQHAYPNQVQKGCALI
jgi:hypothetical protein